MIYNPPNIKDKNLMGRLIGAESIEKEKIDEYFENFEFDWEDLRDFYNNFKMNFEFIYTNKVNNEIIMKMSIWIMKSIIMSKK